MLPKEEELLLYIQKEKLVNFTKIAKKFRISNHIVPDLLDSLLKNKKIQLKKVGSSKIVEFVEKG